MSRITAVVFVAFTLAFSATQFSFAQTEQTSSNTQCPSPDSTHEYAGVNAPAARQRLTISICPSGTPDGACPPSTVTTIFNLSKKVCTQSCPAGSEQPTIKGMCVLQDGKPDCKAIETCAGQAPEKPPTPPAQPPTLPPQQLYSTVPTVNADGSAPSITVQPPTTNGAAGIPVDWPTTDAGSGGTVAQSTALASLASQGSGNASGETILPYQSTFIQALNALEGTGGGTPPPATTGNDGGASGGGDQYPQTTFPANPGGGGTGGGTGTTGGAQQGSGTQPGGQIGNDINTAVTFMSGLLNGLNGGSTTPPPAPLVYSGTAPIVELPAASATALGTCQSGNCSAAANVPMPQITKTPPLSVNTPPQTNNTQPQPQQQSNGNGIQTIIPAQTQQQSGTPGTGPATTPPNNAPPQGSTAQGTNTTPPSKSPGTGQGTGQDASTAPNSSATGQAGTGAPSAASPNQTQPSQTTGDQTNNSAQPGGGGTTGAGAAPSGSATGNENGTQASTPDSALAKVGKAISDFFSTAANAAESGVPPSVKAQAERDLQIAQQALDLAKGLWSRPDAAQMQILKAGTAAADRLSGELQQLGNTALGNQVRGYVAEIHSLANPDNQNLTKFNSVNTLGTNLLSEAKNYLQNVPEFKPLGVPAPSPTPAANANPATQGPPPANPAPAAPPAPPAPPAQPTFNARSAPIVGNASTYNPFKPGWRSGGPTTSTGSFYNPNGYDAALQLGLAQQYNCGIGAGNTCSALVEYGGRQLIVNVNDNGPLTPGRIIDLNEASMNYFGGMNAGVLQGVKVTILQGTYPSGPVNGNTAPIGGAPCNYQGCAIPTPTPQVAAARVPGLTTLPSGTAAPAGTKTLTDPTTGASFSCTGDASTCVAAFQQQAALSRLCASDPSTCNGTAGTYTEKATGNVAPLSPQQVQQKINDYLWSHMSSESMSTINKSAAQAGMSPEQYAIGGMDPNFKENLYIAGQAMDKANVSWNIVNGYRSDYNQQLICGSGGGSACAPPGWSYHGGSVVTGGYGHGMAADISGAGQQWLLANGQQYGIGHPYSMSYDAPHFAPTNSSEYVKQQGQPSVNYQTVLAQQQTQLASLFPQQTYNLVDANGNLVLGPDGNPLTTTQAPGDNGTSPFVVDSNGKLVLDQNGQPIPVTPVQVTQDPVNPDQYHAPDDRPPQPAPVNPWAPGTAANPYPTQAPLQPTQIAQAQPQQTQPPQQVAPQQPIPQPLPLPTTNGTSTPASSGNPIVTIVANPTTVASSSTSKISWSSVGTTACQVGPENGSVIGTTTAGSAISAELATTTMFIASCETSNAVTVIATTSVTVQ